MIYLDNNATTPLDLRVFAEMQKDLCAVPYNPSSVTFFGRKAKTMLIDAKRTIASYLGVLPHELYFTSGATEANYWLSKGFFDKRKKKIIITSMIEHPSVRRPLESLGAHIHNLPIQEDGSVSTSALASYLQTNSHDVCFIFLSVANSETGAILNYQECADIAQKYNVPLILDAVQTLGKMELKIHPGISAMSFSAHKVHGPKGVGLVFLKHGKTIAPLFLGGYQQEGMRAGTENLSGILGFAKAIELIDRNDLITMQKHVSYIEERLKVSNKEMKIHGGKNRIANTSNIYFPNTSGENLLIMLEQKGVIVSLGSACASGSLQPSAALLAMGLSREEASNSLRISLSRMTTKEEVEKAVSIIEKHVCQ